MVVATATEHETRAEPRPAVTAARLAGTGGLVFVAALVVQNVLRAHGPGLDAGPGTVTAYFLHHRAAALIPLGMFPIEILAFFAFASGVWTSTTRSHNRWWATMGTLGVAAIAALFSIVNIVEIVVTAKAETLAHSPDVVGALWAVHGAAFGLDLAAIAVALIGLSRAAAAMRLIPSWLALAAWPAAACLFTASVFTVALVNGGPWVAVGAVGFVVWLVFVIIASISLLRSRPIGKTAA